MDRPASNAAASIAALLEAVRPLAQASGVFGGVSVKEGRLVCIAKAAAAPASYRLYAEDGSVWLALVMADRWLSESIETDLMHTGDKMESLLEEELIEQGAAQTRLKIDHFRSDDLLFTFRSRLPVEMDAGGARQVLPYVLGYEACFRALGDMNAGDEE